VWSLQTTYDGGGYFQLLDSQHSYGSWSCENYTKLHFWSSAGKKDKVENEKEVRYQPGFDLAVIKCEETPFFLWQRPVRNPCPDKRRQKYVPPVGEVTINQN